MNNRHLSTFFAYICSTLRFLLCVLRFVRCAFRLDCSAHSALRLLPKPLCVLHLPLISIVFLTGCAVWTGVSSDTRATAIAEQENRAFISAIDRLRRDYRIPGMSVIVMRNQQEVLAQGLGYADLERRIPASEITPYHIASLTKPLATTLLLQLVEQGRLDLDAPFAAYDPSYTDLCNLIRSPSGYYVPDYNCYTQQITVRHHLTHTTQGIPGSNFEYQGGVFGVLARVISNVAGRDFESLLVENIIVPLNMTSTASSQRNAPARLVERLAKPYQVDSTGKFVRVGYPGLDVDAGAGIISTVVDLAKFDVALDTNLLISEESKALLWTPTRANDGHILPYGLGWFVQDVGGTKLVWHFGWWPGAFSSLLLKVPEQGLTFILLANGDGASAPFVDDLGTGNVLASPFATTFLNHFAQLTDAAE